MTSSTLREQLLQGLDRVLCLLEPGRGTGRRTLRERPLTAGADRFMIWPLIRCWVELRLT